MKQTVKMILVISCFILVALIAGCSENPSGPENNNSGIKNMELQAAGDAGVLLYGLVSSARDASALMNGQNGLPDTGLDSQLMNNAADATIRNVATPMVEYYQQNPRRLHKVMGREVVWVMRWQDEQTGAFFHAVLEYDSDNGHAYAYQVITQIPQGDVIYDSSAIELDANFTLEDSTDDMLISFKELKKFRAGFHILSEYTTIDFDDYTPGSEPSGGFVTKQTVYSSGQDIIRMVETMESHAKDTGAWEKHIDYANGQEHFERIDFSEGGGTFEETLRDGTHSIGSFNTLEDDNIGHCTKTTTYPPGHDLKSVQENWDAVFNPADSTTDASFSKTTVRLDGTTTTEQFDVDEFVQNGYRGRKISAENSDGTGGEITCIDTNAGQDVEGWWIEDNGQYILADGSFYTDGSARLNLTVYASKQAFENGEQPLFTGQFFFNPDGSGKAELVADNKVYKIDIDPDGSHKINS
ncbi:hypothetical protein JW935_26600 [candidate division KSB1 bacterium]|nr:hypothetical protein [candidate division KSB1 bacterium]